MRGTRYLSACRQTVSLWASTPSRALNTTTPPSSTRRLRSTSAVKSTWPGVSMRLIVIVLPGEGHAGRIDGDAAFLLFGVEVGDGVALVDVAQAVRKAAVKQHPFGDGGFSGVDMGNDADIAKVLDIVGHGGGNSLKLKDLMIESAAAAVNRLPLATPGKNAVRTPSPGSRRGTGRAIVNCVPRPTSLCTADPPAVGLDDLPRRRQPQAGTAFLRGIEGVEGVGLRLGVHAAAGIDQVQAPRPGPCCRCERPTARPRAWPAGH